VPVVRAHGIVKRYGSKLVLDELDVEIGRGVTGLLGSNGAGKTTLISLLLGLRRRDAGALTVLGHDPQTAGIAVRERIGYGPEHHNLPPEVQAQDLVRHLTELHGIPPRSAIQRASDALWQVGLGEERLRPVGTMSTGQRQRVKLASAIAHDPALVLLDEPTDGLDPVQRDDMLSLIRRIGTEFGIDIDVSSHHLEEVERICDAVVILDGGRVIRSGTLTELRRGAEGLLVDVDNGHEALAERLRAAGLAVELVAEALVVVGEEPYDLVRDAVADLGLGLRRLEPRRRTLEDVYLEASG
jgi:ABC-2 type transport system ATP-binding protein